MKQLETQVQSKGFVFQIIERSEFNVIQSQKDQQSGVLLAYEVFRINKNAERAIAGVTIAAAEARPGNEQFGSTAWCYSLSGSTEESALAKAKAKFAELEQQQAEREVNRKAA